MSPPRYFYADEPHWPTCAEQLKLKPCPHCHASGTLIRHGHLHGYDEAQASRKTVRGHRLLCSNRHNRPGCGRTITVWAAHTLRRLSLTADALWRFLQLAVTLASIAAAVRAVHDCHRSDRTWQRLWQRVRHGQAHLRTALVALCPPPPLPDDHRPEAHVLAHLQAAFPDAHCPIAAFQLATCSCFV